MEVEQVEQVEQVEVEEEQVNAELLNGVDDDRWLEKKANQIDNDQNDRRGSGGGGGGGGGGGINRRIHHMATCCSSFWNKTQIIDADNLIASPFHSSGEGIRRGSIRVTSELVPHYFSATSTLLNQMKGDKCNLSSRTGNLQFMAQDQCSVSIKVDDFLPNFLVTHTRLWLWQRFNIGQNKRCSIQSNPIQKDKQHDVTGRDNRKG